MSHLIDTSSALLGDGLLQQLVDTGRCTVHCKKYPYIHGYFVACFSYFKGTGSVYTFVSVIDGIMKHKPTLQCGQSTYTNIFTVFFGVC